MRRVLLLVALCGGCDAAEARGALDARMPADAMVPVDVATDAAQDAASADATPRDAPPDGWAPNRGPDGPAVVSSDEQLWQPCAELDPGPADRSRHRDLVTMYDGLGAALAGLDTPTVHGLWHSAPYLHDGSAPTLRAVLVDRNPTDRHGRARDLTRAALADLEAFLLALDGGG